MSDEKEESLISHLEALRETLLKCIISLCVVFPFVFFAAPPVLNKLIEIILGGTGIKLNYFSPMEVFLIQIKTAFVLDLIVCCPYIAKKLWDFILPALYDNERKFIKSLVLLSSLLFVLGVAFCLFVMLPFVIKFGLSFSSSNINPMFSISNIVSLALIMSLSFGLMFQMPLITHALIKSGVVSYEAISDKRPYVIVIILIIAGILTPPDVVSQITLGLPTYLLLELGLLFSRKKS